jgi:hypothetical protein
MKWWEARALMDMGVRKYLKDRALRGVLREGVRVVAAAAAAVGKAEREREGDERRYREAFEEFARGWLRDSTCLKCGVVLLFEEGCC